MTTNDGFTMLAMVGDRRRTLADVPPAPAMRSFDRVQLPHRRLQFGHHAGACRRTDSDSLVLAKTFGKRDKNVLQAYDNLKCSDEFNRLNFQPVEFTDENSELRRSVTVTKDGFTMLAMGFTGPSAMAFKEAGLYRCLQRHGRASAEAVAGVPCAAKRRGVRVEAIAWCALCRDLEVSQQPRSFRPDSRSWQRAHLPSGDKMAHMIDETTGAAAMAYVGRTPWHELGHEMAANASIEEWTDKAGLGWEVLRSPVLFQDARTFCGPQTDGYVPIRRYLDHDVLYRSDTGAPLGIASEEYKTVQPRDIMGFFDDLVKLGEFQLETAGALSGGRRIWALARIGDGAPIIGQDIVRPYLLLTTSFDGTMATTAKLTAIRVVCHNTLSVAVRDEHRGASKPVSAVVKVNHSMPFDARDVRMQLGIFTETFDKWLIETKLLATQEIDRETASRMVCEVLKTIPIITILPGSHDGMRVVSRDPLDSLAYRRIMALFDGEAIGSDLAQGQTKWQLINSITQWIDHERGRTPEGRLNSAWFGPGEALKRKAYEIALCS